MLVAAKRMRETVKGEVETYTPYPMHGIDEALGLPKSIIPKMVGTGALFGVLGGYTLLYWCSVIAYPINVGGRPLHSAPAFIPITFECGVLLSALTAFFGVLAWMGYPRLYHPVFEAPGFRRAIDRSLLDLDRARAATIANALQSGAQGARRRRDRLRDGAAQLMRCDASYVGSARSRSSVGCTESDIDPMMRQEKFKPYW